MGFVQVGFLAALGALVIPLIIHLIFHRRTRQVDLGTLRFLKVVLKENARWRRVKRWFLLALRMACIALLVVTFARPYLLASAWSSQGEFVVLLIDRSASMSLPGDEGRLIDQAVSAAQRIIRQSGERARIEIAFFDSTVHPVGGRSDSESVSSSRPMDRQALMEWLQAPEAMFSATNYGAALAWARDLCVNAGGRRKRLHIFTDLQRSGLDWSQVLPMPPDVDVQLHDLGRATVNNVAITAAQPSRVLVRPGDGVLITATIFNAGPFPLEGVPITLRLEDGRRNYRLQETATLEPGAATTVQFDMPILEQGNWKGQVSVETEDDLSFDNQYYLSILAKPPDTVLLVDGGGQKSAWLSATYFLEAALRLAAPGEVHPESPFAPTVLPYSEGTGLPDLEDVAVVILANVTGPTPDDADRLARFVARGGGLLVFCGENVQADGYRALHEADLTVGQIVGPEPARDLPWRLREWERTHPIFGPFNDPQHGDLMHLSFHTYTSIQPHDQAQVLAKFRDQRPALLERRLGTGRVLWFTSTCDRQWSEWPRSRLYLPFVHQMLNYLTGVADGGPVRSVFVNAAEATDAESVPGVYRRSRYWEVVNVSPRESEVDRCTAEEFADRFGLPLDEIQPTSRNPNSAGNAATRELRDDEVWHWALFALLGILLVENFVSNRTAV